MMFFTTSNIIDIFKISYKRDLISVHAIPFKMIYKLYICIYMHIYIYIYIYKFVYINLYK